MPAAKPASDLTSHLGYWLRFVSNHVSYAFARKLDAEDVTVAEWAVLRSLYGQDAMAPSRLAVQMGLTRGAISKLVDRLAAKGFIGREDDETDKRTHVLRLTPDGRQLVPRLSRLADQNDAEFFDHLTVEERAGMERILRAIVEQRELKATPVS